MQPQSQSIVGRSSQSIVVLTDRETRRLIDALAAGVDACPIADPDSFIREIDAVARSDAFPGRVRDALGALFARSGGGGGVGFLVIRVPPQSSFIGSAIDAAGIPETPSTNAEHVGARTMLARIQAAINQAAGETVAYEAEGAAALFQDMVPCRAMATRQTSTGSGVELEIHTEQAFSDWRPDALSLACLRGNAEAETYVLDVETVLRNVTDAEAELMRERRWTVGVDESFLAGGKVRADRRGPVAVLSSSSSRGEESLVFDQDLMRGVDDEAEALRLKIVEIYRAERRTHVLSPGEILVLDNRRVVHGRSRFRAAYDGRDRFIVRSFVMLRDAFDASERVRDVGGRRRRTILAEFS